MKVRSLHEFDVARLVCEFDIGVEDFQKWIVIVNCFEVQLWHLDDNVECNEIDNAVLDNRLVS